LPLKKKKLKIMRNLKYQSTQQRATKNVVTQRKEQGVGRFVTV
jgi:hypothetical protein